MMQIVEPGRSFTDKDFDRLLEACWEQIALYAFAQYKEAGRGAVLFERHGLDEDVLHDQVDLGYAVYELGRPEAQAARMIEEYDPEWEIVFQYLRADGNVRTARIRTAPGNRHPWRIYLFERLMQKGGNGEGGTLSE